MDSIKALAPAFNEETVPDPDRVALYDRAYHDFRELYPRLRPYFHGQEEAAG
jgi:sugar (pentulose or hexulose) kinase